jgi:hypothetical protein
LQNLFKISLPPPDYIDLLPDRDSNQRYNLIYKDYPVFKFINFNEMRLDCNLNLYPKQLSPDINFQEIVVLDKLNNPLYTISSIFPKKYRKAKECIEFLYHMVLANSELNKDTLKQENYYFILQNPKVPYIYQLLIDNNCELFNYEGKADILYRLQPLADDDIALFNHNDYLKIFVFFQSNVHTYIDPIVIYFNRYERLMDLKTVFCLRR